MYVVRGAFEKFDEVTLHQTIGSIGVYVIWDDKSDLIPKYIGQGSILKRLCDHNLKFKPPLHGYISILGYEDDKKKNTWKAEAELMEAALLWVAEETGRISKENRQPARVGIIDKYFNEHGVIRVSLKDYDPFSPPKASRKLTTDKKIISLRPIGEEEVFIEHSWRRLRGA